VEKQLSLIQNLIYEIRGHKVMLDSDLARLYGVEVKRLNEATKRNIKRFPINFMFQLTDNEWNNLKPQFATSSLNNWGGKRKLPYVFTEHGILMLSSVLSSDKAIEVNIAIMEIFVKMRQLALKATSKIDEIKELRTILLLHIDNTGKSLTEHSKIINQILKVLNHLTEEHDKPKDPIGFKTGK
jgi:phage regulator Rha-like protein